MLIAVIGLIISIGIIIFAFMKSNIAYYYSIEELLNTPNLQNQPLRITGSVLGDTIQTNFDTGDISFFAVNIPVIDDEIEALGGLDQALHKATLNSSLPRLKIIYNGIKPDLLVNEAQVIANGYLDEENNFIADELLLKCPSKYEERINQK